MTIKPIDMSAFQSNSKNLYEAIIVTAKRARQLHDEQKIEFNQRLETLVQLTSPVTENEEDIDPLPNPDQAKLSVEFEGRLKPTEVAMHEYTDEKIEWSYKETPPPLTLTLPSDKE
jgi:DNA-directed RNA polymerase subunit K/omega